MNKITIVDSHYDIMQSSLDDEGKIIDNDSNYSVDIEEMLRHRPMIRCLASFVRPKFSNRGLEIVNESLDKFYEDYRNYVEKICIIKKSSDIHKVVNNNLLGIILSIENGSAIQGNLNNIKYFYDRGVRMMGITWNEDNELGCGVATQKDTGLTPLGKEYIQELNRQKIIIDVSHASPKTIDDVLEISKTPIIASHSCAKSICKHRRNLSDEQLKNITQKGGMVGVTLYSPFLNESTKASVSDVVKHIEYMSKLVGIQHIGIGTDFQIFEQSELPDKLKNLDDFKNLYEELKKNNFEEANIAKVLGGNFVNFMSNFLEKDVFKHNEIDVR